jgi:hypothetical protein
MELAEGREDDVTADGDDGARKHGPILLLKPPQFR